MASTQQLREETPASCVRLPTIHTWWLLWPLIIQCCHLKSWRHKQSYHSTFLWFRISHIHAYESFTHIFSVYVNLSLEAVSIVSNVTSMQCPAECLSYKHSCSPPFWKPHSCTLHHLETTLECNWAYSAKITSNLVHDLLHKELFYLHQGLCNTISASREQCRRTPVALSTLWPGHRN